MNATTTATVNGQYAYRAWDGQWYVVVIATGNAINEPFTSRQHALAAMAAC